MLALTVAGTIIGLIMLDIAVGRISIGLKMRSRAKSGGGSEKRSLTGSFDAIVMPGVFHHRGHTWAHWRPDGEAVVGANDLIHRVSGKIDEVRPPAVGESLKQGEKAVMIRQGDRVLYLVSPLTGVVTEVNGELAGNPGLLKQSPYEKGWIYSMAPDRFEEDLHHVMLADKAEDWIEREKRRMKFFLEDRIKTQESGKLENGPVAINGILERLSDETWVLFKDQFIYQQEWRR